jgi:hypothetical protein
MCVNLSIYLNCNQEKKANKQIIKNLIEARSQWHMPVILATWETEIPRISQED